MSRLRNKSVRRRLDLPRAKILPSRAGQHGPQGLVEIAIRVSQRRDQRQECPPKEWDIGRPDTPVRPFSTGPEGPWHPLDSFSQLGGLPC